MAERRSVIVGTGSCLPEREVTNAELSTRVDTSDDWIVERTGIRSRRIAAEGETTSTLATVAARHALEAAGVERTEEHKSELQSLMRITYSVFCLKKTDKTQTTMPLL